MLLIYYTFPGNVPTPTPAPLMVITPVKTGQQLYIYLLASFAGEYEYIHQEPWSWVG